MAPSFITWHTWLLKSLWPTNDRSPMIFFKSYLFVPFNEALTRLWLLNDNLIVTYFLPLLKENPSRAHNISMFVLLLCACRGAVYLNCSMKDYQWHSFVNSFDKGKQTLGVDGGGKRGKVETARSVKELLALWNNFWIMNEASHLAEGRAPVFMCELSTLWRINQQNLLCARSKKETSLDIYYPAIRK